MLKGALALLGSLTIVAIIVLAIALFSKDESWCNKSLNAGDCELYEEDGSCYCINKISSNKTDYYEISQASCRMLRGHLTTPNNVDVVKWLAKRLYFMGVNSALIGLRKIDSIWYWMKPEGKLEATDLIWRDEDDEEQNQHLTHASIDVRSIIIQNDQYYNGYRSYNYDFYVDYDSNYRWFGFKRTSTIADKDNQERYHICHYTSKTKQKMSFEDTSVTEITQTQNTKAASTKTPLPATTAIGDTCECNQYEAIDLNELGDSKIITSPGYPKGYCYNQECGWLVKVQGDFAISLQWMAFNTEDAMDFVFVYDAQSEDFSKLLATCTGTACPNQISSGQSLYIHFTSDHVTQDIGFSAMVAAIDTDVCYCSESEEISLGSTEESFSITSPSYLNDNCENQKCKWIISGPKGYGLHIAWNQFSIGSSSTVALQDGDSDNINCFGEHCDELITDNTELTIHFTSGSRTVSSVGFSGVVKVVHNYCDKNDLIVFDSIEFTKEKQNGMIAVGGTATVTCPKNHKIIHTQEDAIDSVDCIAPQWNRQIAEFCHLDFVMVSSNTPVISTCNFGNIEQTKQVPVGHSIVAEVYDMTNGEDHSSVEYHCTAAGWSPEYPICAKMTQAILIIGGFDRYHDHITMLTLYMPNKKSTQLNLELPNGRVGHASVLMNDGNVMVTGGMINKIPNNQYLSNSYIIDVNRVKVSRAPDTNSIRYESGACQFNEIVYVCAGDTQGNADGMRNCETFDGYSWSTVAPGLDPVVDSEMVALNASLYTMGGIKNGLPEHLVQRYSTDTGKWQLVESMQERRTQFGATVLGGIIYVCGGKREIFGDTTRSCEQYVDCDGQCNNFENKIWKKIADMNIARRNFVLVSFEGKLYALGGMMTRKVANEGSAAFEMDEIQPSVESYDPNTNEWTIEELELPLAMEQHTAVVLHVLEGIEKLL